ncbi:MAG: chemotaxis response regulator protein-glutamate methylesterase, partial [Planctomycetota bacterium]
PEVIVVDLGLERNDAIRLIQQLRQLYPVPVIALAPPDAEHAERAVQALNSGVAEVLVRPPQGDFIGARRLGERLVDRIRAAIHTARPIPKNPDRAPRRAASFSSVGLDPARYVVAVGASTGGPQALRAMLRCAPRDFPPIVIVQHMPVFFTKSFAANLDHHCAIDVREAVGGETLAPGTALIARGDTHLVLARDGLNWTVRYTDSRLVNLHCPSVDVLFDSAVAAGSFGVGVLLTGMGADGASGLLHMRRAGALTIAQDRQSSIVYGMPKAAAESGAAALSAPPERIPGLIARRLADAARSTPQPVSVK